MKDGRSSKGGILDNDIAFEEFPKIARLNRTIVITEKLDGTNAQVIIAKNGRVGAASRTRLITREADNYGFAAWVQAHKDDLMVLGPGRHFGEWCGQGIQRGYGLKEKRFSLFNVGRWNAENTPACVSVVPELYSGPFSQFEIETAITNLRTRGSVAVPGFMKPEGIVIYHTAANLCFKVTLEKDSEPKGTSVQT